MKPTNLTGEPYGTRIKGEVLPDTLNCTNMEAMVAAIDHIHTHMLETWDSAGTAPAPEVMVRRALTGLEQARCDMEMALYFQRHAMGA